MAIPNVTLSEKDLYYQWLINNNSTSTMFNALSGNSGDVSSSFSVLSSLADTALSGSLGLGSVTDDTLTGVLGSLTGVQGAGSVSSFAKILESYLDKNSSGVSGVLDLTENTAFTAQAAKMAEKLSGVLEEAAKTEDISSLTYKTVKEIYDYFSGQVSGRAAELLGEKVSELGSARTDTQTVLGANEEDAPLERVSKNAGGEDYFEKMDQMAVKGEEFDFSVFDELVNNSFGEKIIV